MKATLLKRFGLGLLLLGAGLPSCDTIDAPVPPSVTSTLTPAQQRSLDSLEALRPVPVNEQRVLLEDFTGQFCGNCPRAAAVAAQLKQQYGERLVVIGEHMTDYFAAPKSYFPYQVDYRVSPYSLELENAFGLVALPKGAVNRLPRPGSSTLALEFADWGTAVQEQLARPIQAELLITPQYQAATHTLNLKIATRYINAQPGRTLRLGVFLTEDNITGGQKDYDRPTGQQDLSNYVHRHVLRATLAGTFGSVQASSPATGRVYNNYLGYVLPVSTTTQQPLWNTANVSVVAYLADDATKEIVQVAEVHL
jgi:thiol-disulfide isomerase/thioredoxin